MAEYLSDAALYGYGEIRACRIPDPVHSGDGVDRVPKVDFDSGNQNILPCNAVAIQLGVTRKDLPISIVPPKGCFEQRYAGLCPRGLNITEQEIESGRPL